MQKREKRAAILQAALELIGEQGFQNTPMSLIAKRAGASAGIIYHYFESKDDLIQALYRQVKSDLSRAIFAAEVQQIPPAERFSAFWINMFRYCVTHPHETAFLAQYETSPAWELHEEPTSDEEVAYFRHLEEYKAQGLIKDLPLAAIYELTLGIALKLARQAFTGVLTVDDATLTSIAQACWDAIAR
ncbi:MAG TPA: TetR/AcrR family transcriptional regulator [Ktedonobacteraceae bacterium]|nr:TetR/AcrR family transcriptional regulator [Ktedonobacteraceae bacterium]